MKFPEYLRMPLLGTPWQSQSGDPCGLFRIPPHEANGRWLKVIATDGEDTGWNHVSVSLVDYPKKTPSWEEMCAVKRLFWSDDECVVQFHPPQKDYINFHSGVLHLWKCVNAEFPMPPKECV